jgi:hypothetical protein
MTIKINMKNTSMKQSLDDQKNLLTDQITRFKSALTKNKPRTNSIDSSPLFKKNPLSQIGPGPGGARRFLKRHESNASFLGKSSIGGKST